MTPGELERYLHEHIPLSRAMQVSVVRVAPESVVLGAPLAPNINHRETVFGGSASAVALLAAWSLVHTRLHDAGLRARLVVQRNTMSYGQPIAGEFTAHSALAEPAAWEPFIRLFGRRGRARIAVSADLVFGGESVGHFEGDFVALRVT